MNKTNDQLKRYLEAANKIFPISGMQRHSITLTENEVTLTLFIEELNEFWPVRTIDDEEWGSIEKTLVDVKTEGYARHKFQKEWKDFQTIVDKLENFDWNKINTIPVEFVKALQEARRGLNAQTKRLKSIEFTKEGEPLLIEDKLIEKYLFTGMLLTDFIDNDFWKEGFVDEDDVEKKHDVAAERLGEPT